MGPKAGSDGQWEDGPSPFAFLDECGGFQVHDAPHMLDTLGYLASLGIEKQKNKLHWQKGGTNGSGGNSD